MRANYPTKTVAKVKFTFDTSMNLNIYKKCEHINGVGLENHLYHAVDNGRIRMQRVCEVCGEILGDDITSLSSIGDELISVDKDQIKALWGAGDTMKLISCPSVGEVSSCIMEGKIVLNTPYEITPDSSFDAIHWRRVLVALELKRQCLSVNVPIKAQLRRGLIFPSGMLYTLYFENEIRENRPAIKIPGKVTKAEVANILETLESKKRSISKAIPKVTPENVVSALLSG